MIANDPQASLQAKLEAAPAPERTTGPVTAPAVAGSNQAAPAIDDPVALLHHLEAEGRFHRDSGFGRIFHPGQVSFRENRATDSLHLLVDGNHITAHVDRVSPLVGGPERSTNYSLRRAVAHNLGGAAHDFVRLVRGRQGDHRSHLDCEWTWDGEAASPEADDLLAREATAWSVQIEAEVGGRLDEGRLRAALEAVFRRHRFEHDPLSFMKCPDDAALDDARMRLQRRPATMTDWPPLRAVLARQSGDRGDVVMLNVNHAASDGFDAARLLDVIAAAYATGTGPEPPADLPVVERLPVRPTSAGTTTVKALLEAALERFRNALTRPAPITADGSRDSDDVGFHHIALTTAQTGPLVDPDQPGTSRDILLAAVHRTIGEWNLRHGAPGRRVGVLIPVDLRPADWPAERVGNFSVTARVSTSRRHRRNPSAALRAVTAQTSRNRRARTGIALLEGLERSGLLPLWSKQSLVVLQPVTRNRLVDTALVANLGWVGEPPSFGRDAGPTSHVWFSLPARAPQTLCLGAVTVDQRLHLVLRYPRRLFGPDAARRFAGLLCAELGRIGETRPLLR